ncbi:MAG: cation:proton antiporter [Gammaproteobacteria bacterium]|nr:cation:proton antiporter [Gammaproteobacteria bacterium]MBU2676797.1 cation:proton antiporter [Gammaproteobacteria bacterium]NNL50531.1 cation:proton antiporter [Woeseiaceae bacterium]
MAGGAIIGHGDPIAPVILGVTTILAFAIIGRVAARKLKQPTVLGELLMGILLGNLAWYLKVDLFILLREGPRVFELVQHTLAGASIDTVAVTLFGQDTGPEIARIITGPHGGEVMQVAHAVDIFSRYGVIFMLFMVGLQTNLEQMRRVGADSARVALIGVALPLALGFAAVWMLRPALPFSSIIFVAATLGATSLGITARVLEELDYSTSREGRIILGAAVYDDILGLIILAVVSGIVLSGSVDVSEIVKVILISSLFLAAAIVFGPAIVRFSAYVMKRLDLVEAKMFTSYLFVMVLAWMANLAGLATIIGAFAAGVVLSDSFFEKRNHSDRRRVVTIRELIMPLEVILVPIFFILIGMQVKVETFMSAPVATLAAGLLVAAVIGKLASGLGARRPVSKLIVGIGMTPRGEVGLVFAAIGRTLGVIDDSMFAALVLMIIVTTLGAPAWLKISITRQARARRARRAGG